MRDENVHKRLERLVMLTSTLLSECKPISHWAGQLN